MALMPAGEFSHQCLVVIDTVTVVSLTSRVPCCVRRKVWPSHRDTNTFLYRA